MIPIKCKYLNCFIFCDCNSPSYLLLYRSKNVAYPSLWQPITATVEDNETAVTTVLREIDEETRLKPKKLWSLEYCGNFFSAEENILHLVPYFVAEVEDKNVVLSDEHDEYRWVDIEKAIELTYWQQQKEGFRLLSNLLLKTNGLREELRIDIC